MYTCTICVFFSSLGLCAGETQSRSKFFLSPTFLRSWYPLSSGISENSVGCSLLSTQGSRSRILFLRFTQCYQCNHVLSGIEVTFGVSESGLSINRMSGESSKRNACGLKIIQSKQFQTDSYCVGVDILRSKKWFEEFLQRTMPKGALCSFFSRKLSEFFAQFCNPGQ